jgi:radical SAM protein (TIGR01212 family)
MMKRYNDFNRYLRGIFGCRVQKISIDAGFSCPNRDGTISINGCIYCNDRGSGTGAYAKGLTVTEQIVQGKKTLATRYKAKKFIAYFQAFSNTYAPIERLRSLYDEALAIDDVVGIAIGTRPDCVNESVLDLLQKYVDNHLVWLEYGLQSANDTTLELINRGHDVECFRRAVAATKNRAINICAHIILGLPGEGKKDILQTAKMIGDLGIDGVKIHLLYVVKGTKLDKLYMSGRFTCLEQQEYVDLVCDFIEHIPAQMVIQRLTGDPHPEELAAPMWSLRKTETLNRIKETLAQRDSWQGKFVEPIPK